MTCFRAAGVSCSPPLLSLGEGIILPNPTDSTSSSSFCTTLWCHGLFDTTSVHVFKKRRGEYFLGTSVLPFQAKRAIRGDPVSTDDFLGQIPLFYCILGLCARRNSTVAGSATVFPENLCGRIKILIFFSPGVPPLPCYMSKRGKGQNSKYFFRRSQACLLLVPHKNPPSISPLDTRQKVHLYTNRKTSFSARKFSVKSRAKQSRECSDENYAAGK